MNRAAFFDALRAGPLFGGKLTQGQVENIDQILDAFAAVGDGRPQTLAYALATVYGEVGRAMAPVREGFASHDAEARRRVAALARKRGPASAPARYGKPVPPYGHVYYGRGYVQLTWADNYKRSSADAGLDLLADPDRALDPVIAARLLILGLIDGRWNGRAKGIAHYLSDRSEDLEGARRTVNITDRWQDFAGFYRAFLPAVEALGPLSAPVTAPSPAVPDMSPELLATVQRLADWLGDAPPDAVETLEWLRRMPA